MMNYDDCFFGLPHGVSSYDNVSGRLIECGAKKRLPQNAKSVISVIFPYYLGEEYYKNSNISRYAVSADYHIIAGDMLKEISARLAALYPCNVFEPFMDSSPLPEVRCAVSAGLGVLGKNNLFISPVYGSWVFLGEIVTDLYISPTGGELNLCSGCSACADACPCGAINGGGINPQMCLSYLNQKKGELDDGVAEKMEENGCYWGCDVCQKVCPMNKKALPTPIKEFYSTAIPHISRGVDIDGRAFGWRGRAVIERNLSKDKG